MAGQIFFENGNLAHALRVFQSLLPRCPKPDGPRVVRPEARSDNAKTRKICREEIAIRRTVFLVAAGRDSSPVFSAESNKGPPGILPKRPKTGLTGRAGRHHSVYVRSKYFKKSEKKACHASKTSVILTAKPNQTQWRN